MEDGRYLRSLTKRKSLLLASDCQRRLNYSAVLNLLNQTLHSGISPKYSIQLHNTIAIEVVAYIVPENLDFFRGRKEVIDDVRSQVPACRSMNLDVFPKHEDVEYKKHKDRLTPQALSSAMTAM